MKKMRMGKVRCALLGVGLGSEVGPRQVLEQHLSGILLGLKTNDN